MDSLLKESVKNTKEILAAREYLHAHAEVGFELPKTTAYLIERLQNMGYEPTRMGSGVVATAGKKGGACVLLRADVDALPIPERSGLKCAAKNGNMHACGHDMHAAMLLGAAALLKEREGELSGEVKLLFQPAEELLLGAKDMIERGVLTAPKPTAAMMVHVMTAVDMPTGCVVVASGGVSAPAADFFTLQIKGKGCHGSTPWEGVDALTVGARVLLAWQELAAREIPLSKGAVLTVGSVQSGKASNALSDFVELKGTLRAFDEGTRARVKTRMQEIASHIAKAFHARAQILYEGGCPTLVNDEKLSKFALKTAKKLLGEERAFDSNSLVGDVKARSGGSEDFAYISQEIPSVMVALSAGEKGKGYAYPLHHPKAKFDEGILPVGSALYARFAMEYLRTFFKEKS